MIQQSGSKLLYINNLRILLIMLIVSLHVAITYGAAGSWYYYESTNDVASKAILTMYCAITQSFSLGFFFMISGYFTPRSYARKGPNGYFKDRLLRLGLPLLVYYFIISPIMTYTLNVKLMGKELHIQNLFGSGPLWFVETLLIFAVVFHLCIKLFQDKISEIRIPHSVDLLKYSIILSLANFMVRIWWKIGDGFSNLQFAFFPGYISLFIFGVIACKNNWFNSFSYSVGIRWFKVSGVGILLFPVLMVLGGATNDASPFMGGLYWQSLVFSTWEAFVGTGLIAGLYVIFREKFNYQGKFAQLLSDNAYTVYIIHAPIVVFVSYTIREIDLYPLLKFVLAAIVELSICFALSHFVIKKIPYTEKIL